MQDDGEPTCRGQVDRKDADAQALRHAIFGVALSTLVVLVNGILAMLFIGSAQAIGWLEVSASEGAEGTVDELSSRLRPRAAVAGKTRI